MSQNPNPLTTEKPLEGTDRVKSDVERLMKTVLKEITDLDLKKVVLDKLIDLRKILDGRTDGEETNNS